MPRLKATVVKKPKTFCIRTSDECILFVIYSEDWESLKPAILQRQGTSLKVT